MTCFLSCGQPATADFSYDSLSAWSLDGFLLVQKSAPCLDRTRRSVRQEKKGKTFNTFHTAHIVSGNQTETICKRQNKFERKPLII